LTKVYFDEDADESILKDKTIAIIGYGNQGRAQAMNVRDSGFKVIIGNIKDEYWEKASKDGFKVYPVDEASKLGDIIVMLIPDEVQPQVYKEAIEKNLKEGKCLVFGSGFNVHYGFIKPPEFVDVILVAPVCPGIYVRENYLQGSGTFGLVGVHQNHSGKAKEFMLAYAKIIGVTKRGAIESSFAEETETDLFTEVAGQGIIPHLLMAAYEVMIEAGYSPEAAYTQTFYEFKFMGDVFYNFGTFGSVSKWSRTAQYLVLRHANSFITDEFKQCMKAFLKKVQNGEFARDWALEHQSGEVILRKLLTALENNPTRSAEKLFINKHKK
jgi:ketol-acid reductoisomerase